MGNKNNSKIKAKSFFLVDFNPFSESRMRASYASESDNFRPLAASDPCSVLQQAGAKRLEADLRSTKTVKIRCQNYIHASIYN